MRRNRKIINTYNLGKSSKSYSNADNLPSEVVANRETINSSQRITEQSEDISEYEITQDDVAGTITTRSNGTRVTMPLEEFDRIIAEGLKDFNKMHAKDPKKIAAILSSCSEE